MPRSPRPVPLAATVHLNPKSMTAQLPFGPFLGVLGCYFTFVEVQAPVFGQLFAHGPSGYSGLGIRGPQLGALLGLPLRYLDARGCGIVGSSLGI